MVDMRLRVIGPSSEAGERVLTHDALQFVAALQGEVGAARDDLLRMRTLRQADLARGVGLDFHDHTREVRETNWRVAEAPADLTDRRVEITGPVERKMM